MGYKYMNYVVLINKNNKIKESFYKYLELDNYLNLHGENILAEKVCLSCFIKLQEELKNKNIIIDIIKGYDDSDKYIDYCSGFGLNITINSDLDISLDLSKYGFIISEKRLEFIHIRYVGRVVASIIYKNNWTLEEYFKYFGGVLIVNKEVGVTSRDVVNDICHIFGLKKVGHTGTLDPLASGVLVITMGQANKIGELLTSTYKEYEAGVLMGVLTDTLDITGKIINSSSVNMGINISDVLDSFKGSYMQEVPIYSAVKINGKKLYDYARSGESVELPKRKVNISDISLISSDNDTFTFKTCVSKGTYIRSLIRDIGNKLDCYATMTSLIRTKQGKFSLENSNTIDEIRDNNYSLYSIEDVIDFPVVKLDKENSYLVSNGVIITNTFNIKDKVLFKSYDDKLLGIYEVDVDKLKTWKNFR